jgi:carbon-monoxide dehydrogenase medium subunit
MRCVKPPPFTYHRPQSLDDALGVLAEFGPDAKVLAGGQSLLPILSMRLASPGHLVDINRLPGLSYVRAGSDGLVAGSDGVLAGSDGVRVGADGVRVGALTRHADLERDDAARATQPLLGQALRLVAHPTIRNRGTSVGSLAHADPSGELTAVLALTGGRVTLLSLEGRREVPAADFFLGPLESAVQPGELAVEAFFPAFPARTGTAFVEVSRRHGDYAVCGVAAAVTVDEAGAVLAARTGYISMGPVPVVLDLTDAALAGGWQQAARAAVERLEPEEDIHAGAAYRGHLAGVLTARALRQAADLVSPPPKPPSARRRGPAKKTAARRRLDKGDSR